MESQGLATLAILIGVGIAAIGPGIGMGIATAAAINAVARQPESLNNARTLMIIGIVFMETLIIYTIALVLFAKYVFNLF
ncbi:MAG: hypothetical protein A2Y25_06315 [Candidatus Melainabacteria bacterium GWF2_37_15]|nr:MAG: hypothetical protein A2Y25_06315 [Candidatus Melainabacteria bacterium GWF2_37_15]